MKPRNKHQRMIAGIDKSLRKIKVKKVRWAYKNCLPHFAVRSKKGVITCMDCSHTWQSPFTSHGWQDAVMGQKCPNCKEELEVHTTFKRKFYEREHFTSIETHKENQVIRSFLVYATYVKGKKVEYDNKEVSRIWITPEGRYEIIGYSRNYYAQDAWYGEFSLKDRGTLNSHTLHPKAYYPEMDVLPIIRRNGFKDDLYELTPYTLFDMLLNYPHAETLIKSKQYELAYQHIQKASIIDNYWPSIKIAIRNNYIVKAASDWMDYIELIELEGKDILSPKYVCPENLHDAHQKAVARAEKKALAKAHIERIQKIYEEEESYEKSKGKYFDLSFNDKLITIEVISSVKELVEIGSALHHCIYNSNYHEKENSLLMVAKVRGEIKETIEFSLKSFELLQARGLCNKSSRYHNRILDLITKNIPTIRNHTRKKKRKTKTQKAA